MKPSFGKQIKFFKIVSTGRAEIKRTELAHLKKYKLEHSKINLL